MGFLDLLIPKRTREAAAAVTTAAAGNVWVEFERELVFRERVSAQVAYSQHIHARKPANGYNRRGWEPNVQGPLWGDFTVDSASADEHVRQRLQISRERSRALERTNPYAKRFFSLYLSNVIGEDGLQLKPGVTRLDASGTLIPDDLANRRLREEWDAWGLEGNCTLDGGLSWRDVEDLLAVSWQRDGEALLRLRRIKEANRWGFLVEPIESDRLDVSLCTMAGENEIRMGIEFERNTRRIVAYHLLTVHPGDRAISHVSQRYERVPAEDIVHLFSRERIGQSRGTPRMEAAMARLQMLGGYEEAEVVAARAGSSKFGVVTTETGSEYEGDDIEGEPGSGGTDDVAFSDFQQGTVEQLGRGQKFELVNPTHPTTQYGSAVKSFLRGVASALPTGYNSLANDLEGVNYSSLRHATLEERDQWKREQRHFARQVSTRVFRAWLDMALLTGALQPLQTSSFDRYTAVRWVGKRWTWIDPLKEAQGNQASLPIYAKTVTEIAEERGRTVVDIAREIQSERQVFDSFGIEHPLDRMQQAQNGNAGTPPDSGSDTGADA